MNLDQMLVSHVENQDSNALVRALLLRHFGFGSICFFLVGLQAQRNSFFYLVVGDDHEDTSFHVVTNDTDAADNCNKADKRTEGEVQ